MEVSAPKTRRYAALVAGLLLGLALLSSAAYGQATASIVGTVTDPSGAAVANAKLTITNIETGLARSTVTNSTGSYAAHELAIGHYRIRAEAPGFKAYEQSGITLEVNDTMRADLSLQVGQVQESVTVEANRVQVEAQTSDVSQTVTDTQIENLATNGRNVLQLTTLVPGASSTMPDFDLPVAQFQNRSVYFNGLRQDANNWLIDGGEAYDRGGGGILIVSPSQEALQEFKVQTSNYAADLGNSSGGMINMAMKTGTRTFHGSAWEYNRNDMFDAANYLAKRNGQPTPELRYNAFGFNIGGPLEFRSSNPKTFFFYNQEWRREIQGGSIDHARVPTAAEYGGNLSTMLYSVKDQNGNSVTVHPIVPNTTDPARLAAYQADGLTAGQPFPNDTIPSNLMDSNATLFLNSGFVVPANATGGYFSGANTDTFYREEAVRLDHQFTDKMSVFGHFIYDSGHQTVPTPAWTGTTFATLGSVEDVPSWAGVVHFTNTINPSLLNEAAFNYNGNNITLADNGKWTQPSGWSTAPLFSGVNKLNKMPTLNVGGGGVGFNYDPGNWPWTNTWRSYQGKDDLSWTHGTHNFKFGGAWLHTHKNQEVFADVAGNYNFSGNASWNSSANALQYYGTGYGLGDFLLGNAANFTQVQLQDFVSISFNTIDLYAMDDWRLNKRLTLNLGLRWEGMPHAYDTNNRASNFYPSLYDPSKAPVFLNAPASDAMDTSGPGFTTVSGIKLSNVPFYMNGVGLAGRKGVPNGLVQNHWKTFAPRLGFALDLTGNQKTILRGGAGIFYERNAGNEEYLGGTNVPFTNNATTTNPDLSNPVVDWTSGANAGSSPYTPHGFYSLLNRYPVTTTYQFNLGIQEQLTSRAVFDLSYVGNTADHLSQTVDINLVPLNATNARLAILSGANANFSRPFLGWSGINQVANEGNSHYNSLQASLRATAWKNLTVSASYTYSHAFDVIDGQLFNNISNPYNPRYDYGTAGYDRRHIAVFSYVYELPIFRNSSSRATKAMLGGWTISGVTMAQTGTPLTVNASGDVLGLGGNTTSHANLVAPITYPKTFNQWFSTGSFAQPAALQFGTAPRNIVKGPGRDNWNLSLYKTFQFTERAGLQFRAESFNTWNHTQFTGVDTGLNGGGFGKINAVADPRVFQFGAKVFF